MTTALLTLALVLLIIGGAILAFAPPVVALKKDPEPTPSARVLPLIVQVPKLRPEPPSSGWG